MKKILLFICFGVLLSSVYVCAQAKGSQSETVFIPFIKNLKPHPHLRSVSIIPFDCFYNQSTICIHFYEDIGEVYVTIFNYSTGEQWCELVDSSEGHLDVVISDSAGDYSVTLDTEYTGVYSGGFSL